jgi:AraC-like DNA-binding protein
LRLPLDVARLAGSPVSGLISSVVQGDLRRDTPSLPVPAHRASDVPLRTPATVTDICMEVGFSSLGSFSRTFTEVVGESPSEFRRRGPMPAAPSCFVKVWARPSSFGEAT